MTISIKKVYLANSDEWDAIWQGCDYSTYFHSREWAEIWKVYSQGKIRPEPKLVLFSDGKKALLPISAQKIYKGMLKQYVSSPASTFGGWISLDKLSVEHADLLVDFLTEKISNLSWRLNPYDELLFKVGIGNSKYDETHTLNLEGGFDSIYKKWTKGNGSTVRKAHKARKEGVSVTTACRQDDWLAYYQVYQDSLRRWGSKASSVYEWNLFKEIFQRNSPKIKLWLAYYQNKIVSGALCFYAKKHVVYWHGAALEQYFHLRPVNLLMYEVIKDACEQEYSWFDFNPSGGHEGVKAFKKSFGAEALQSSLINIETNIARGIRNIAHLIPNR